MSIFKKTFALGALALFAVLLMATAGQDIATLTGFRYAGLYALGSTTGGLAEAIASCSGGNTCRVIPQLGTTTVCNLTVPANVSIYGLGNNITVLNCGTNNLPVLNVTGSGVEIRGVTVKHSVQPIASGDGIVMCGGCDRWKMYDLHVYFNYNGLNIGYNSYAELYNSIVEKNENHGVVFSVASGHLTQQTEVKNVLSEQNGDASIANSGDGFHYDNNVSGAQATCPHFTGWTQTFGNHRYGYSFTISGGASSIADCWLSGTFASQNNASGYFFDGGGRNAILNGVYAEQSGQNTAGIGYAGTADTASNAGYGIEITANNDPTNPPMIAGVMTWENSQAGIKAGIQGVTITGGNHFNNGFGTGVTAPDKTGVRIDANDITVVGNYSRDGSSSHQTSGIYINSGDTPHLSNNSCNSNITTCISVGSQPTNGFQVFIGNAGYIQNTGTPAAGLCTSSRNGWLYQRTDTGNFSTLYACKNGAWGALN